MVVSVLKQMRDRMERDNDQHVQKDAEKAFSYRLPIPDDLWIRCPECGGVMAREEFGRAGNVCLKCGHHFRIGARQRIDSVSDAGTFVEWSAGVLGGNPLDYPGYTEKIAKLRADTGMEEAVICGECAINGYPCAIAAMDSRFLMGSMGSAVGEKITALFEQATVRRLPVVLFSASGGARMQEGVLSLMQMAKTAAATGRHHAAGLLYISVMTDPTTGGVTASFASLGDILLSEPGTLIGFAGRRVIEGTISQELPEGFQRARFLLEHGFLDAIVPRSRMKDTLSQLIHWHTPCETAAVRQEPPSDDEAVQPTSITPRKGSECLRVIREKGRPSFLDYLPRIFEDYIEMHGDRNFRDDEAIWGGIALLGGRPVTVIAHQKGRTLDENVRFQFGMPHPEGYRKALRLMKQAEKFGRPILCFVDTPGAFCGIGAEERGQGEAIARNLMEMMTLRVPVISVVIGEGGSGGALAVAVSDRLAMLSNAVYSVISPRGFASLLWKDPSREMEAADVAKITAYDLARFGICDTIIPEPDAGAHADPAAQAGRIRAYLLKETASLCGMDADRRLEERYARFRKL